MKLSASILATKITDLSQSIKTYDPSAIDYIHMDVMDGNYVPQISFGEAITKEISESTKIPLDVHLMVKNPELHVPKYFSIKPEYITFHLETTEFSIRLANEIRQAGIKVGVSLNPQTPIDVVDHLLESIDLILVMTVDPGFYGQKFFAGGISKISRLKDKIKNHPIQIEVDGGVNPENIAAIQKAGADICVVGAALFKGNDPNAAGKHLKSLCSTKT